MHPIQHFILVCFLIFVFAGPSHGASSIYIAAYNVENLWDAKNDPDQGDPAFIPMREKERWQEDKCEPVRHIPVYLKLCEELDWTEEKYRKKLASITKVISALNGGKGPDILVIEEIEHLNVVRDLLKSLSPSTPLRYYAHFESPGRRGIDVAVLSKFRPRRKARHEVAFKDNPLTEAASGIRFSRDILEVEFQVSGASFIIAANHWPSQASTTPARMAAAQVLLSLAQKAKKNRIPLIATGDFNTLVNEDPNPIADVLAGISDEFPMIDLNPIPREGRFPPSTHWYRGEWSPLDRFLISKDLLDGQYGVRASVEEFEIHSFDYLFTHDSDSGDQIPDRYNFFADTGYSDHLPIGLQLRIKD